MVYNETTYIQYIPRAKPHVFCVSQTNADGRVRHMRSTLFSIVLILFVGAFWLLNFGVLLRQLHTANCLCVYCHLMGSKHFLAHVVRVSS